MNEELLKIRDIFEFDGNTNNYYRLKEKSLLLYNRRMNENIGILYNLDYHGNYDEKEFAHRFIANIFILLNMFNDMNIFPGYFFRKTFEMNDKYYERRKDFASQPDTIRSKPGVRGDYRFYRDTHLSVWLGHEIKKGLDNGYFHVQAYPKTNISDAFTEILGLFQRNDFTYKVTAKEDCKKVFDDIWHNYMHLTTSLLNSDTIEEDVEYMSRLLFDHLSFFVGIGINPKRFFDEFVNSMKESVRYASKIRNLCTSTKERKELDEYIDFYAKLGMNNVEYREYLDKIEEDKNTLKKEEEISKYLPK